MRPAWLNDLQDERRVRLSHLFSVGDHFHYTYDFGDNWRHEVLVEKVEPPEVGAAYPRCTGGRRACPPEDSGGAWGYAEMVSALGDPDHEQHVDATNGSEPRTQGDILIHRAYAVTYANHGAAR